MKYLHIQLNECNDLIQYTRSMQEYLHGYFIGRNNLSFKTMKVVITDVIVKTELKITLGVPSIIKECAHQPI